MKSDGKINGLKSPVVFNTIIVNIGNVWQKAQNAAIIPAGAAGIYYIHLQGAAPATVGIVLTLNINGMVAFTLNHNMANKYTIQCREKAAIVRLNSGDKLTVSLPLSYSMEGGGKRQSSFNDFRLA